MHGSILSDIHFGQPVKPLRILKTEGLFDSLVNKCSHLSVSLFVLGRWCCSTVTVLILLAPFCSTCFFIISNSECSHNLFYDMPCVSLLIPQYRLQSDVTVIG